MIKITDIKYEPLAPNSEDKTSKITIKLKDHSTEARVHVFAQHFIPTNAEKLYKGFRSLL